MKITTINTIELKSCNLSIHKTNCMNCGVNTTCVDVSHYEYEPQILCELCLREIINKLIDWENEDNNN